MRNYWQSSRYYSVVREKYFVTCSSLESWSVLRSPPPVGAGRDIVGNFPILLSQTCTLLSFPQATILKNDTVQCDTSLTRAKLQNNSKQFQLHCQRRKLHDVNEILAAEIVVNNFKIQHLRNIPFFVICTIREIEKTCRLSSLSPWLELQYLGVQYSPNYLNDKNSSTI